MEKTIAAATFGLFEIINYFFGHGWIWSEVTEEEIGVLISALMPFVIWFVPNGRWLRRS